MIHTNLKRVEGVPLFLRDFSSLIGKEVISGVWLITAPRWHIADGKWTALADYHGALALIELTVKEMEP